MKLVPATRLSLAALAALVTLGGCGDGAERRDDARRLAEADPALTSALEDQILVDPNLVQQAYPNRVRPPGAPVQAQYPPPPLPAALARASQGANCADALDSSTGWAGRLPAQFPLYPGGRVVEAAGAEGEGCRLRVVVFRTADPAERVLGHYRRLAERAGYAAEVQQRGTDHVLGAVNARTDEAFVLVATPLARGTDVAFVVDGGG